jgi:hypothetical protein
MDSSKWGFADWFSADSEIVRIPTATALNDSIQAGEPELLNLSALRLQGVTFSPISQFHRRQLFCMLANPRLDECTGKPERSSAVVKAAKRNVNVRVLGVVVDDRHPFQLCQEAPFDPTHQIASVLFNIQPLAKFWRDDDLEHPFVASGLPGCQTLRNVDGAFRGREPDTLDVLFSDALSRAM